MTAELSLAHFDDLVAWATAGLAGDEVLLAHLTGEDSDFVRFNHAAVRQAGSVHQRSLRVDLVEGARHATSTFNLTGERDPDRQRLGDALRELREIRALVPDDPFLLYSTGSHTTERVRAGVLPGAGDAADAVISGAAGSDLVGIYAAGETFHGFASSLGQRNWSVTPSFTLDWSLHLHGDKATKHLYAGTDWDDAALAEKLGGSVAELDALARAPIQLPPGGYRAYLAPAALRELLEMMSTDGFGLRAHRTRRTPLLWMVTDGVELHPSVRISEHVAGGLAPDFQTQGFVRPEEVVLVEEGRYGGHLVSPRSAVEYGVDTNGAEDREWPVSVAVAPGDLPAGEAMAALGTGLYVGNLWYLNFSDRAGCRTTGMTRFGTFWVEGGEVVAPVDVLRFDDTAYHLLGDRLVGLTDTAEMMLDTSTYGARSTESWRVPGALVEEMTFTL